MEFDLLNNFFFSFLKRFDLFTFRQKGREGEREGEKYQRVVASRVSPTGDLVRNPGMCPDGESNQGPFGSQAGTQSPESHQQGPQTMVNSLLFYQKVKMGLKRSYKNGEPGIEIIIELQPG